MNRQVIGIDEDVRRVFGKLPVAGQCQRIPQCYGVSLQHGRRRIHHFERYSGDVGRIQLYKRKHSFPCGGKESDIYDERI